MPGHGGLSRIAAARHEALADPGGAASLALNDFSVPHNARSAGPGDVSTAFFFWNSLGKTLRKQQKKLKLKALELSAEQKVVQSAGHLREKLPNDECIRLVASLATSPDFDGAASSRKILEKIHALSTGGSDKLLGAGRGIAALERGGMCSPSLLKTAYQHFLDNLSQAQVAAFSSGETERWLQLQRADDLTRFLSRADVSQLTLAELCNLGKAVRSSELAGRHARTQLDGQLSHEEAKVPDNVSGAIGNVQRSAKQVAAQGFRCQATQFLWI